MAALVSEGVCRWAEETGTQLDVSPPTPGSLSVGTYGVGRGARIELYLLPDAGVVRAAIRGDCRGDERHHALDGDAFEPGPLARALAEEFLAHAEGIAALETLKEMTR